MTLEEIKQAVDDGKTVCWSHSGYEVIKSIRGEYYVLCKRNNDAVGLTRQDGTLECKESDFFILEPETAVA